MRFTCGACDVQTQVAVTAAAAIMKCCPCHGTVTCPGVKLVLHHQGLQLAVSLAAGTAAGLLCQLQQLRVGEGQLLFGVYLLCIRVDALGNVFALLLHGCVKGGCKQLLRFITSVLKTATSSHCGHMGR